jgi:hypothetical protein
MPNKLSTTVKKIDTVPNPTNSALIRESYKYMRKNDASERNQNNSLMVVIAFANFLRVDIKFCDLKNKEQFIEFLNTKVKSQEHNPEGIWITMWNHYLVRIKHFLRWL